MMRNEIDLSHERPSRVSRVVVILSTLGVALIAAWVFVPILLASYTATVAALPKPRELVQQPLTPRQSPVAAVARPDTTAVANVDEDPAPPAAPGGFNTASASPWPQDLPQMPAAPAAPADSRTMTLASASALTATADAAADEVVPLPRKRPSLTIAARLAIPLPRPRPDIETDVPPAELTAFELQIRRQQ